MSAWILRIRAGVLGLGPRDVALVVAAGLVLGVFPIIGCPTVLCLIASVRFRINPAALQVINNLASPVQLALLFPLERAGAWLCGDWAPTGVPVMGRLGVAAVHAVAGWGCVCVPFGIVLYFVLLAAMQRCCPSWSNSGETPA